MSHQKFVQVIKTKDKKTQEAVSEYVALAQLDRVVKTPEDRITWEQWWHEFLNSDKWILAISFIQEHGI